MAVIYVPRSFGYSNISKWGLSRSGNVARSKFTGQSQRVTYPYALWAFEGTLKEFVEPDASDIRAFLVNLSGQENTFDLPVPGYDRKANNSFADIVSLTDGTTAITSDGIQYRVNKTLTDSWGNSSVISSFGFNGDCLIRIKPIGSSDEYMVGLNIDPFTNNSYASIDRALILRATGDIEAVANGNGASIATPWTTNDYIFIQRIGSTIKAYKGINPTIDTATLIYTFADLNGLLYLDTSILKSGSTFDVLFSQMPMPTFYYINATAAIGSLSVSLNGLPVSSTPLKNGQYININSELKLLTADVNSDVNGIGQANFFPALRTTATIGTTINYLYPFCRMASTEDDSGIVSLIPPARTGLTLKALEAYP